MITSSSLFEVTLESEILLTALLELVVLDLQVCK